MSSRGRGRRRPAAARPSLDNYQPPRITKQKSNGHKPPEVKQIPVFYVDDKAYTMPAELPPSYGLRYLRTAMYRGYDVAQAELLVRVLGEEAFNVLCDTDEIKQDEMAQINAIVIAVAMGAVDPGKDSSAEQNSSAGS